MNNVCQVCKKARATVHLTEIDSENSEPTEMHLCENCARESGASSKPPPSVAMTFASSLIDLHKKEGTGSRAGRAIVCPECEMTYQEFRVKGRFGCLTCYDAFESGLLPLLEKVHGATEHVGPPPTGASAAEGAHPALQRELIELRRQLKGVVDEEKYEEAARLRDRITEVEQQLEESDA